MRKNERRPKKTMKNSTQNTINHINKLFLVNSKN
jgi:hypothetical protein